MNNIMRNFTLVGLLIGIAGCNDAVQQKDDLSHSSAEWKISAYSTAAPGFIGDEATILDANGDVLRQGSNGWYCRSANPRSEPESGWASAHEAMPLCMDSEGLSWLTQYMSGKSPELERDAYLWMLHGDVGEDNTTPMVMHESDSSPQNWIESGAHLMLMPKDPSTLSVYGSDFNEGGPYTMFPGTPHAHLMIPVSGYYDYQPQDK
jgi:hypothetical protein